MTNARRVRAPARQRGLTLVELMIALVLGLLVIAAATGVYLSNRQAYVTNNSLGEIQDNARIAYELLARDIRQAGTTGCESSNVLAGGVAGGNGAQWYTDVADGIQGFDDPASADSVAMAATIVPVAGTNSIRTTAAASWSATIKAPGTDSFTVNEANASFTAGNLVMVCDPSHAEIGALSSYDAPTLNFADTVDFHSFLANSLVSTLTASDWYIGKNAQGTNSLYRIALTTSAGQPAVADQEMVRGVQDMQLRYHLPGHNDFVTADTVGSAWAEVDAVRLDLTLQGSAARAGTDEAPISRHLSGVIALRNRG